MSTVGRPGPITRDDIQAKFRELRGEVDTRAESAKATLAPVLVAVAAGVVVLAFMMGRRRGRKRTAVVEIRRY
jgi:hypothetical protein